MSPSHQVPRGANYESHRPTELREGSEASGPRFGHERGKLTHASNCGFCIVPSNMCSVLYFSHDPFAAAVFVLPSNAASSAFDIGLNSRATFSACSTSFTL